MLVNIGYGNVVNMDRVVSIVRADAAPIKRMIQVAKDELMEPVVEKQNVS